nr:hypothetical protein C32F10.7 - Caenorhabditis elegans [Caenorhabditis elegans]
MSSHPLSISSLSPSYSHRPPGAEQHTVVAGRTSKSAREQCVQGQMVIMQPIRAFVDQHFRAFCQSVELYTISYFQMVPMNPELMHYPNQPHMMPGYPMINAYQQSYLQNPAQWTPEMLLCMQMQMQQMVPGTATNSTYMPPQSKNTVTPNATSPLSQISDRDSGNDTISPPLTSQNRYVFLLRGKKKSCAMFECLGGLYFMVQFVSRNT